jgi:hypothetical protein
MNQIPVHPAQHEGEECDPFMRVVSGLGMALFIFGIFVPGAHTLMMVGLALIAISYVV